MVISTLMIPVPEIPPFNLAHDPLDGRSLIEASAGTGKTYTIAGLFIRLIIEKRLQPGQILVVTFTQAATEELRGRVRRAIREALDAFTTGATDDPFLRQLLVRYKDWGETAALLVTALRCFDEAAVHTIHGFCQRMLEENAFESGSLFDTELESDDACLREIVQDFWRLRFHDAPDEIAACAAGKFAPDVLLSFVKKSLPAQDFTLLPDHQGSEPPSMGECFTAFRHVQAAWQDCRNEVADILVHNPGLKRTTYRTDSIPGWLEAMDGYLDGGLPLEMFDKFSNFCQVKIKDSTKKGHEPPCHSFFDLCEALFEVRSCAAAALDRYLLFLRGELVAFIRRETPRRRSLRNTRSFDDILTDFHAALHGEQQELLVAAVREKFPVALIDEFQDTDPVQYGIFRRIYGSSDSVLFLIGDPKQAIYSFRGADVFAYFRASRDVDRRYTLGHNWRSAPCLVAGVNALFAGASDPFVFPEIQFHPVAAGLRGVSEEEPPLRFWFLPREGDDPISAVAACDLIAAAVADEIVRVIDNKEVTHPGEIAVLVRSNHQAQLMARVLASRRVPSVVCNAGTVFQSDSASELLHFLAALLDSADEGLVRRALVTDMFGLSASQLYAEAEDEERWLAWLEKFHRWREVWERSGIIVMARSVLAGEGIRTRLLRLPDGERRLTDLLQCIELLQQTEHDENLGMDRLFEWLRRRIVEGREQEEYLVRLETDESAVKIVTIHKSKGLEYEVVFCPFCWSGSREKKDTVVFHDRSDGGVIVDMGSDAIEDSRALAEEENLAENLRLLYVAVTRARRRCYVAWGGIRDAGTSSLAYLFHGKEMFGCGEKIPLPDDLLLKRLFALRDAAPEAVLVSVLPPAGEPVRLFYDHKEQGSGYSCAVFHGKISHDWRISSFSSLIRGAGKEAELPDRDHLHSVEEGWGIVEVVEALKGSIFSFPRGATAGTFLHEVFERVDFQGGESGWRDVIGRGLRKNGYSPEWEECVAGMVADVLGAELTASASRFRLADIVPSERLHEMEFHLPVAGLATDKLAAAFLKYGSSDHLADTFKRLAFEPVKGYLKGFIDLVFRHDGRFYLLDWKSNHLGNALSDYEPATLHSVMERELYFLQAHLYTVALHRYLSLRVPGYSYESHFGGVFYLFIRGIRRSDFGSAGVYHTCPDIGLVEGLSGLFRGDKI